MSSKPKAYSCGTHGVSISIVVYLGVHPHFWTVGLCFRVSHAYMAYHGWICSQPPCCGTPIPSTRRGCIPLCTVDAVRLGSLLKLTEPTSGAISKFILYTKPNHFPARGLYPHYSLVKSPFDGWWYTLWQGIIYSFLAAPGRQTYHPAHISWSTPYLVLLCKIVMPWWEWNIVARYSWSIQVFRMNLHNRT